MTTFVNDLREVGGGLASRIRRLVTMIRRTSAVPLAVRAAVWAFALLATVVAVPFGVLLSGAGLLLVVPGMLAAALPRTRLVTLAVLVPIAGWTIATAVSPASASPVRLLVLAGAAYLVHSSAALAAVLPYDAIVAPAVLWRWSARALLVLAASTVVGGYLLIIGELLGTTGTLLATAAGCAVAAGTAALLIHMLRRR